MQYRTLPGTELKVSEICLGTMTWGQQNSEAEAHEQLDYAIGQGINFIDTAEMYPVPPNAQTQGRTEKHLGTWLARQQRSRLYVATKIAGPGRRGLDQRRPHRSHQGRDRRSGRHQPCATADDYIDIYQIHWPQRNVPMFGSTEFDPSKEKGGPAIHEQVEGMAAMIKAGKIRHYGLSNETAWGVCEFHRAAKELGVPGPVTLQNSYSLISRNADNDLAEALFREKMSCSLTARLQREFSPANISAAQNRKARASRCSIRSASGFASRWSRRRSRPMRSSRSNAGSR
jgi:aryl-alcohol dehydrogenase (NADP+)